MPNAIPTKVVDKNGRLTTVLKNPENDINSGRPRIHRLPKPPVVEPVVLVKGAGNSRYDDDPHNTHFDFTRKMDSNISTAQQMTALHPDEEGFKKTLEGYKDASTAWSIINEDGASLSDVRDRMVAHMLRQRSTEFYGRNQPVVEAYDAVLSQLLELRPIIDGEPFVPARGRMDISTEEKSRTASFARVSEWAEKSMGIALSADSEPVSFKGADLVTAIHWILLGRQKDISAHSLNETYREFIDPDFSGDITSSVYRTYHNTTTNKDLRDFLIEIAVIEGRDRA